MSSVIYLVIWVLVFAISIITIFGPNIKHALGKLNQYLHVYYNSYIKRNFIQTDY